MDLATLTAAPDRVTIGGREFLVGPLRYRELGILQRHLNSTREKSPVIGRDAGWPSELLSDVPGVETFIAVLFGIHQEMGPDDILHVLSNVGPKAVMRLLRIALEVGDKDEAGGDADPKG